jgi:hypothetical protein
VVHEIEIEREQVAAGGAQQETRRELGQEGLVLRHRLLFLA